MQNLHERERRNMRVETDMVGSATIDEGVYYGLQTLRAS